MIDSRAPRFEPPETEIVLACRYASTAFDGPFELLHRTPDRCGSAQPGPLVDARFGQVIATPVRAGALTVATFTLGPETIAQRARDFLWRPDLTYVTNMTTWFRFVAPSAGSLHLLVAPACARSAISGAGPDFTRFEFSHTPSTPERGEELQVTFSFIPYRCPAE